jgi:hypothetical protein
MGIVVRKKLLIVGNPSPGHVANFFASSARAMNLDAEILSVERLFSKNTWINRAYWHLMDRGFVYVSRFNREICERTAELKPTVILVTGSIPILPKTFETLREEHSARVINYSTDDPWNRINTGRWMIDSLKYYDAIATPRRNNTPDFELAGARKVLYSPFAFSEADHRIFDGPDAELNQYKCEVLVYGGADADRVSMVRKILANGYQLHLYGGLWNRYPDLAPHYRGILSTKDLPKAIRAARVVLGMVRHANRDSNCMRSFEVPAMGGCLLPEDTVDHRQLFSGSPSAIFFRGIDDVSNGIRKLLDNPKMLHDFRNHQYSAIVRGNHTYRQRLSEMIEEVENIERIPVAS